ncbi:MAG TPA: Asp23/Gls24 family envelope stress response protein [Caldilineae bacterium]|nr:Asp23/Gls24 family envelope stress response protein [Caldilineae bacterium]
MMIDANSPPAGRVTIAPQVLTTIVRQTTLGTEGVQSLAARRPPKRSRVRGRRAVEPGIEVIVSGGEVHVVLHINADPDANMVNLARTLQKEVAYAIKHIVGMGVSGVDVFIDNVTYPNSFATL